MIWRLARSCTSVSTIQLFLNLWPPLTRQATCILTLISGFLDIEHNLIERVSGFKLIGVYIINNMLWNIYVDYICTGANTRLDYSLKRLKSAGSCWPNYSLVYVCHPISSWILCGCLAPWKHQTESIEVIQRHALRIVYPITTSNLCLIGRHYIYFAGFRRFLTGAISCAAISLKNAWPIYSCIHHFLPPPRDPELTSRLRNASIYPRPCNRTNYNLLQIVHPSRTVKIPIGV